MSIPTLDTLVLPPVVSFAAHLVLTYSEVAP